MGWWSGGRSPFKIHKVLQDNYLLQTSENSDGQPYESSQMHAIYRDPDFDAEIIAQQGVEAAATFDLYCEQPIDSYAIAEKEPVAPKEDRKAKIRVN